MLDLGFQDMNIMNMDTDKSSICSRWETIWII